MRDGVTFYRSFYEALCEEDDPEKRLQGYEAIFKYAFFGEEPDGLSKVCKAAFIVSKPVIDSSNKASDDGKKGGRPRNCINANKGALNPPSGNAKSNDNDNDNENDNDNKKVICKKTKFHNFPERKINFAELEKEMKI